MLAGTWHRDIGALACIGRRDRTADAAVATGDDGDLSLEASGAGIARLPIGFGFERAFMPGQRGFVDHLYGVAHGTNLLI
jgi:hypothetical protein